MVIDRNTVDKTHEHDREIRDIKNRLANFRVYVREGVNDDADPPEPQEGQVYMIIDFVDSEVTFKKFENNAWAEIGFTTGISSGITTGTSGFTQMGSWRVKEEGDNLEIQHLEGGIWVNRGGKFTA